MNANMRREDIQVEVLMHARAVITQWLTTAEKWRYDQVCADFQEMIDAAAAGELKGPPRLEPYDSSYPTTRHYRQMKAEALLSAAQDLANPHRSQA